MCGRFTQLADFEQLAFQFGMTLTAEQATAVHVTPRYNVAPTQAVTAVRLNPHTQQRELAFFQWGLIPSWAKDPQMGAKMINARGETVTEKPAFRAAFKRRRCLIPADGFYEWQKTAAGKQPLYIHAKDKRPFAFGGLWEIWHSPDGSELETCTIVTTTPNDMMTAIHNRMPLIIAPDDYAAWLQPSDIPDHDLHLIRPFPADNMAYYPVSTYVNNPRHDSPQCILGLSDNGIIG